MKQRILVVDDEQDLVDILQFNLEDEGYDVDTALSGEEALERRLADYDLVLLDVMMGEISGFRLARMMKAGAQTRHVPIIFLTARDTENDAVTGLSIGADDYISKPFSIREVVLRVKAVLRRAAAAAPEAAAHTLAYEGLQLNLDGKTASIDGSDLALTKTEYELLALLVKETGRVFTRAELLRRVWPDDAYVLDRTVDVNITRLRRKLGAYGRHIVTRQGYGYCFEA